MTETKFRYIIPYSDYIDSMIDCAFSNFGNFCCRMQASNIAIVVPSVVNFPNTHIGRKFGRNYSLDLSKGKQIHFLDGLLFNLFDKRNFDTRLSYEIVLGAYLFQKDINMIDSTKKCKAIIYFPPNKPEEEKWLSTWAPTIFGSAEFENLIFFPKSIQKELKALTDYVNNPEDLSNIKNNQEARSAIKRIIALKENVTSEEIRQECLRMGWKPKAAEELKEIMQKMNK